MKQLGALILPLGWKISVHHKVTPKIRRYSFIILGKGGGGGIDQRNDQVRSRGRIFRSPGDQQFGYGIPHIQKITSNIIFILVCCCFSKVADCGPLRKPDHGDILEQVAFTYGNRIVFECTDTGYEMKGSRVRTCQSDGTWSGSPTTCESTLEKINQPKKSHIDHVEYFNNGICFATEL